MRDALAAFVGDIQQVPPVHSAIWVEGVRSYHLARRGEAVALKARTIRIHAIELVEYVWPKLVIDVHCAKGTYIQKVAVSSTSSMPSWKVRLSEEDSRAVLGYIRTLGK